VRETSFSPSNWPVKRLRFAIELNPVKSQVAALDPESKVSFVPMEAIGELGQIYANSIKPLEEVYNGYTYFQDGDVVVAKITPCFENGKGALAKGLINSIGFGTTEFHVLRANSTADPRWLYYLTASHTFRNIGASEMLGAGGQKRVPEAFIKNIRVALPPLLTQQKIADFLDRKTRQIDALIEKKRALIKKLKEKRLAVITQAVTRGLNPDSPLKDSGIEWLGQVPEHWEVRRLKFDSRILCGYAFKSEDFVDDGIPLVRISDVLSSGSVNISAAAKLPDEYKQHYSNFSVLRGDIVMAMTGATIGKAARYIHDEPSLLNQRVCIFREEVSLVKDFLWYIVKSAFFAEHVKLTGAGGAQPNISDRELLSCPATIPPVEEQRAIIIDLEKTLWKLDAVIRNADLIIDRLTEYRIALITAAVTGQLEIN